MECLEGSVVALELLLDKPGRTLKLFLRLTLLCTPIEMVLELSPGAIRSIITTTAASADSLASQDKKLYCTCLALLDNLDADVNKMILADINKNLYYRKLLNDLLEQTLPPRSDEAFNSFTTTFLQVCPDKTMSNFFKLQKNRYSCKDTSYLFEDVMTFYHRFQDHFSGTEVNFSGVMPGDYFGHLNKIKNNILVSFGVANSNGSLVMAYGAKDLVKKEDKFKARSHPMKDQAIVKTMIDRLLDRKSPYSEILSGGNSASA